MTPYTLIMVYLSSLCETQSPISHVSNYHLTMGYQFCGFKISYWNRSRSYIWNSLCILQIFSRHCNYDWIDDTPKDGNKTDAERNSTLSEYSDAKCISFSCFCNGSSHEHRIHSLRYIINYRESKSDCRFDIRRYIPIRETIDY